MGPRRRSLDNPDASSSNIAASKDIVVRLFIVYHSQKLLRFNRSFFRWEFSHPKDLMVEMEPHKMAQYMEGRVQMALPLSQKDIKKRKSPDGISTNELVFSAFQDTNDHVFPRILSLYLVPGSSVADVTFGKGVFWKNVPEGEYKLFASDIQTGIDCRDLPYDDGTLDCVVLDPPYMHSPGGTAHVNHQNYEEYYGNNRSPNKSKAKYHKAVVELYFDAAGEAKRVLREEGIFIVKCADEVCANRQRLTHVEIINEFEDMGFVTEDLFVVLRNNRPGVSRVKRQLHARKNHSYFLVFRKSDRRRIWKGVPTNQEGS